MSQENVEMVRRSTDAYNRRDLDGMLETWAQDAVLDWSNAHAFDAGIYRGHGEIRAYTEAVPRDLGRSSVGDRRWSQLKSRRASWSQRTSHTFEDATASKFRLEARGCITFRNGEQTSLTLYQTKQEALEAAGLRE